MEQETPPTTNIKGDHTPPGEVFHTSSRRAPKLSVLKSQNTFSKTICTAGVSNSNNTNTTVANYCDRPPFPRQMSQQDRRATVMTPKRDETKMQNPAQNLPKTSIFLQKIIKTGILHLEFIPI